MSKFHSISPGNGYVYEVIVSDLPGDVAGGQMDTHVLVTLFSQETAPGGRSYVLEKTGHLADYYLVEKFKLKDGIHQPGSIRAIKEALGR